MGKYETMKIDPKVCYYKASQEINKEIKHGITVFNRTKGINVTEQTPEVLIRKFFQENNYNGCHLCVEPAHCCMKCQKCAYRMCYICTIKLILQQHPRLNHIIPTDIYLLSAIALPFKCPHCRQTIHAYLLDLYPRIMDKIEKFT